MKNKKLFAILTLVCFMFTLMPVAAFAEVDAAAVKAPTVVYATEADQTLLKLTAPDGYTLKKIEKNGNAFVDATGVWNKQTALDKAVGNGVAYVAVRNAVAAVGSTPAVAEGTFADVEAADKLFITEEIAKTAQTTLGKVIAKTNPNAKNDMSGIVLVDDTKVNVSSKEAGNGIAVQLYLKDKNGYASSFDAKEMVIWAEDGEGLTSALTVKGWGENNLIEDVFYNKAEVKDTATVTVTFARPGSYTLHAGYAAEADTITKMNQIDEMKLSPISITVRGASVDPDTYKADLTKYVVGQNTTNTTDEFVSGGDADTTIGAISVTPNNVFETNVYVALQYKDDEALAGKTVAIETNSSAISVNKVSDVVDAFGNIDFRVAASIEGTYEIYLSVDGVEWVIDVKVGNTDAAYIETITEPTAPQALYDTLAKDKVEFYITDINGNAVSEDKDPGMSNVLAPNPLYLTLTQKPAASNLTSQDLTLSNNGGGVWGLQGALNDAEGTYAVKVVLDNGSYATAEWTVKKFQEPVRLIVGFATNTVELGSSATAGLIYMDANGVQKDAKDTAFYADGHAVEFAKLNNNGLGMEKGTVKVKSDERYVGQTIKVTAVSNKYELVGTAQLKVVEGAVAIDVANAEAEVNVNNKIVWNVVDASGNKVGLSNANLLNQDASVKTEIDYVILDKPEGAKVSVSDVTVGKDLAAKGEGKMALTSNKVGNVTVQIVLKAEYPATATADMQIKYYTGTVVVPVGMDGNGDVLVMSIGSNEYVINDEVKAMDGKAVIKNGRTMVPLRTGLEALGAVVAWDEATQAVTAEMNGVKLVMTIGSANYTVNGVEKVMDVAPYIDAAAGRTMVPASFAAYAFGMDVNYTTNDDGTVADVIFVK